MESAGKSQVASWSNDYPVGQAFKSDYHNTRMPGKRINEEIDNHRLNLILSGAPGALLH
jgi:hypothetical protein